MYISPYAVQVHTNIVVPLPQLSPYAVQLNRSWAPRIDHWTCKSTSPSRNSVSPLANFSPFNTTHSVILQWPFWQHRMNPLNEMSAMGSKESIPGAYNRLDERAGNAGVMVSPLPIRCAGRSISLHRSPSAPPCTRLFPTPAGDIPALRPTAFALPVKCPVAIIKMIKQILSQAYTDVPLLDKSQCNWDLWN